MFNTIIRGFSWWGELILKLLQMNMDLFAWSPSNILENPTKCSFGVKVGKSLGFMLTRKGVEVNPDKWKSITNMRNLITFKKIQQLIKRIDMLFYFLPCAHNKSFHFFTTLKKREKLEWTYNSKNHFLCWKPSWKHPSYWPPKEKMCLFLYLSLTNNAIIYVLV